jgi:WD40 repeat protein
LRPADSHQGVHKGEVSSCCYSSDGCFVLSGGWDGHLRLWDSGSGLPAQSLRVGAKPLSACAISPEGDQWLAGSLDGLLSRWEPTTQKPLNNFLAHPRPISAIVFGEDKRLLATASWDCSLILWNPARDSEGRNLRGHRDIVAGCRFTPDNEGLLSWSHDGTVRLWDVPHARLLKTLSGHTDRVTTAAVSPDGHWVVSGARDGTLKLWDLEEEREAGSVTVDGEIRSAFFLLDGASFGTVETQGRVRVYSLSELKPVLELETNLSVECAELAPSGQQIALGCRNGRVHFIDLEGMHDVPLSVLVTPKTERTATTIQRLFRRSTVKQTFHGTCPACRQAIVLPAGDPSKPVPCPHCQRTLRVRPVPAPESEN